MDSGKERGQKVMSESAHMDIDSPPRLSCPIIIGQLAFQRNSYHVRNEPTCPAIVIVQQTGGNPSKTLL